MTNQIAQDRPDQTPIVQAKPPSARRFEFRRLGEVGALVVLIVVFAVLNPGSFLAIDNIRTILDQAATPLIVGVGATLVILMGSIDLSVEGIMGASGMAFVLTTSNSRGSHDFGPLAFVIGIALGAVFGLVSGVIHTRLGVPSFIVTLGMWFVALGVATVLFGTDSIPLLPDGGVKTWPSDETFGLPHSFELAALMVILGIVITRYTKLGRFAYAIGNNEDVARNNGIAVGRTKIYIFVAAGAFSGLAGVLGTLQLGAGSATVGTGTLFLTIAAVVIGGTSLSGGRGGILRTTLGVVLLTVLNNGLILSGVSPNVQSGVSGLILVVAIVAAAWPLRNRLRIVK